MNKRIDALPEATSIDGTEIVPIMQGGITKQIPVSDLRPYKVYTATFTQSGTNNPEVNILENTIGTIDFLYIDTGNLSLNTTNDAFLNPNKVVLFGSFFGDSNTYELTCTYTYIANNSNQLILNVFNAFNSPLQVFGGDGRLCSIEIRIYN